MVPDELKNSGRIVLFEIRKVVHAAKIINNE
jgi:hypothetical protein